MELMLALFGGGVLGAILKSLMELWFGRHKASDEADLSDVQSASLTLKMALDLMQEEKTFFRDKERFYDIRVNTLEQEVHDLRQAIVGLQKEISELRKDIA